MPNITIRHNKTDLHLEAEEYTDLMTTIAELNIKFNFETVSDLISLAYRDSKVLGSNDEGLFLEMEGKYVAKFFINSYLVISLVAEGNLAKLINRRYKLEIKQFDHELYKYNPCEITNSVIEER